MQPEQDPYTVTVGLSGVVRSKSADLGFVGMWHAHPEGRQASGAAAADAKQIISFVSGQAQNWRQADATSNRAMLLKMHLTCTFVCMKWCH
jgi:hypothetical protein